MQFPQKYVTCENCENRNDSIFRYLSDSEASEFFYTRMDKHFKKGEIILYEGSRVQMLYCINSGIVKQQKVGGNGREQIVGLLNDGDLFGFQSILLEKTAPLSVVAVSDVHVCIFPASSLFRIVGHNNKFTTGLMLKMCRRLEIANTTIADMAQKNQKSRLAQTLLYLKNEFGNSDDGSLKIALTREEIANIIGTATESVIRLLSDFNKKNYIELVKRKIKLLDEKQLQKIADID